ncbi:MAG: malto-oligosyltrehalose trehalohydrolase [Actinobacteria bacterium]|nr:malto-oligosyltrehalose trehalohydrolase [Actinomycetota bacterium]
MSSLLGATPLGDGGTEFVVWAPRAREVELHVVEPEQTVVKMDSGERRYRRAVVEGVGEGARYLFRLDGRDLPDPASRFQPESVHGPSEVIDPLRFRWTDEEWGGIALFDLVIYELHVGAFTTDGTFDAVVPHLDELADLGITAVEIMPVAQFPGSRNWGYDGAFPFAVQDSYGGPAGLQRLVDECHRRGLAVVLDVVYNHFGPEGNVLGEYGPYFTDRYRTPWGGAINFDGPGSDEVRRYFIENALRWSDEFHVDALRLDAIHGIVDTSARPFLQELSEAADAHDRPLLLIAETDQNDARVVAPRDLGGLGLHAQWSDDFHHALHAYVTGERQGYYEDFGSLEQLGTAYREGFVYSGQYSPFRGRQFGSSSRAIPGERLVVFAQNHDQVGNRSTGDRLSSTLSTEHLKLIAGVLLLAPFVPLLFMGEEYGELAPFQYFVGHTDPDLVENVRRGRREEFASFGWADDVPDPQDETTFESSKLDHRLKHKEPHASILALYRDLLRIRKDHPALRSLDRTTMDVATDKDRALMTVHRKAGAHEALAVFNFGTNEQEVSLPAGEWTVLMGSTNGPPAHARGVSFVVLSKTEGDRP